MTVEQLQPRSFVPWPRVCAAVLGLLFALWTLPLAAQSDAADGDQNTVNGIRFAEVIVDGEILFVVRGTSTIPASERAETIADRIVAVAESGEALEVETEVTQVPLGMRILAEGQPITLVTLADAELEQTSMDITVELHRFAIEEAIVAYRSARTSEALVDSAIAAAAWSLGFLIVSFLFFRFRHRIINGLGDFAAAQVTQVEEATASVVSGSAVGNLVRFAAKIALWLTYLAIVYYYLSFVLLSFAETRVVAQLLLTYISEPIINVLMGFMGFIPNLITLVIIFLVTRYCVQALKLFFDNVEAGTVKLKDFEKHWIGPSYFLGRIVIYGIAIVFAYPFIPGSDSQVFQGLTILAGLMVSLGSNAVVGNLMSGLFVIYRRSTNIGDRIKVGDQVGDVVEIKLMETLLKSVKNEMISIPNQQLLNSEVVNYSRTIDGRGLLVHTTVGIGYDEQQDKVEAMLIEAARRTTGLKNSPAPFVLWEALGDFAINYQVNAFTTRGSSIPKLKSDLHRNIVQVFHENGVQIMSPHYEGDPPDPKVAPVEWDGTLAPPDET